MTEKLTSIDFTDAELNILNDIVRQHKVSISNEELVLLLMGKRSTPIVSLTVKVGSAFETRANELNEAAQKAAEPHNEEMAPVVEPLKN